MISVTAKCDAFLDSFYMRALRPNSPGLHSFAFARRVLILLLLWGSPEATAQTIQIDVFAAQDRKPIDPRIYGVNFGTTSAITNVPYPFRRWGGNSVTRYNWQSDTNQTAADYFFQSIVNDVPDPSALPVGSDADRFLGETLALGREVLLTVPTMGWTASATRTKKWSFSVAKYGPQTVDECSFYAPNPPFWCSADAGNGECDPAVNQTGFCVDGRIVGNDPSDASTPITTSFVSDWIAHLHSQFGTAASGGVGSYALDNEPMLWNSTHRDVHPAAATYDEVWTRGLDVAQAIKNADPDAQVFGPSVWGWCAYFSSAADAESGLSCTDGPDRSSHAGLAFIPWYLEQVCAVEAATGTRPVDVLDIHFYPQGDVSGLGGASDSEAPADAARRLRSVKELYDPVYVSESWIAEPVALIPRMRNWIDQHCAGLELAITEYRWGTDDGASSALAQAEVLAIFGREGVDQASRWVAPAEGSKVEEAFRLYLDYDGAGGQVIGDSVRVDSADVDAVGAYAVSNAADLQLLLFNKSTTARTVLVSTDGSFEGALSLHRFDATSALAPAGSVAPVDGQATLVLPARSATLAVAPFALPEPGLSLMLAVGTAVIASGGRRRRFEGEIGPSRRAGH